MYARISFGAFWIAFSYHEGGLVREPKLIECKRKFDKAIARTRQELHSALQMNNRLFGASSTSKQLPIAEPRSSEFDVMRQSEHETIGCIFVSIHLQRRIALDRVRLSVIRANTTAC